MIISGVSGQCFFMRYEMFVPRNITKESIKVIIWRRSAKRPRTIWSRMAGTRSCNEIVFWEKVY